MTEMELPHWDKVYSTKADDQMSWYQADPEISLRLIRNAAGEIGNTSVIDIGSGVSNILPRLWAQGFRDLTAMDISSSAIERARKNFEPARLEGIVADVTIWKPARTWSIWHDRAVFHFLTGQDQQSAYVEAMASALLPDASAIMATFALDGPDRCSGLPVQKYSTQTLADRLGARFELVASEAERHVTPGGGEQSFNYAVFRRRR